MFDHFQQGSQRRAGLTQRFCLKSPSLLKTCGKLARDEHITKAALVWKFYTSKSARSPCPRTAHQLSLQTGLRLLICGLLPAIRTCRIWFNLVCSLSTCAASFDDSTLSVYDARSTLDLARRGDSVSRWLLVRSELVAALFAVAALRGAGRGCWCIFDNEDDDDDDECK
jgi:hypothetical protein